MGLFSKKQKNKPIQKSWRRKKTKAYSAISKKTENPRRLKFSRFLFWLLLVVFFGICAYLLFLSSFLDITKISVDGNQDISSADISSVVGKSLEGKNFGFFPRKNYFLVNKKNIVSALQNNFNRLEVKSIEKKFPGSISISVTERKAELVWCSAGVCYFVASSGLAFSGAAGNEEELRSNNFLVVVDDSAIPVDIGKTKIDPDYVGYIEAANTMIRDDLKIGTGDSYHTPGMASKEISVRTNEGWILKFSEEVSIDESKKIIQTLFEKELNADSRKNLDYLDLRVKGKVYYKLKTQS